MTPISGKCPKMKNQKAQQYAEIGFASAKAMKTLDAMDEEAGLYDLGARFAWMAGWEHGGGVVSRRIVVTQRMRLEERKAEIQAELESIGVQLAALDIGEQK